MAIGPDRVQVLKQESAALGGDGADDVPYTTAIDPQEDAIECAGVYLQDGSNRDESVYIERAGAAMRFVDPENPSGFSLLQLLVAGRHELLDSLTHDLAENADTVVTRSSGQISSIVVWTDGTHTVKIREILVTRTSNQVSQVVINQYDGGGALSSTLTKTITRSSGRVSSIATVRT